MKKLILTPLIAWSTVNTITLLIFAYRYVWFSVSTVPADRALLVAMLTIVSYGFVGISSVILSSYEH